MSRLKDKLAASVRQVRDGGSIAAPASPRARKAARNAAAASAAAAPPVASPPAVAGTTAQGGFACPDRVWPD